MMTRKELLALDAEELVKLGYTIDRHTYPWTAYKGPRFMPTEWFNCRTPAYPPSAS